MKPAPTPAPTPAAKPRAPAKPGPHAKAGAPARAPLDPTAMLDAADRASELLKSLGNRHRLLILCQLAGAERSVGELAVFLGLRDSTVSQHLSLLRKDGLVRTRRDAQTIWYAIASEPAARVLETLFEVFCKPSTLCELPQKPVTPAAKPRRQAPPLIKDLKR